MVARPLRCSPHPEIGTAVTTEQTRDSLLIHASRLREIANLLGLSELATTIVDDTHRRLDDAKLRAVVIGEIKQGKSTLINALVGEAFLPTGVTPTTGATVVIRSGAPTGPFIQLRSGQRQPLDTARFTQLVKDPNQSETGLDGSLEYVLDASRLPAELEVVDTPGINDLSALRAAISRGELPRADILLLVLDATQLLNRTELAFLRDAIAAVGGLQGTGATLLIAVNRIDLIAERERPKLVEHLHRELQNSSGDGGSPPIDTFDIFLTDARTSVRDPQAETPGVQGIQQLRQRLIDLTATRKDTLPMRARASLLRYSALLGHHAAVAARALSLEPEALDEQIEHVAADLKARPVDMGAIRTEMAAAREELLKASDERLQSFRAKLEKSAEEAIQGASHRTMASHLSFAVHDAYVHFAKAEANTLRQELDALTQRVLRTHSEQVRRRVAHATMRIGFQGPTFYIDPPSALLEAGLVAIGVVGTAIMYFGNTIGGLVMTVAGPLATVVLREKSIRDARIAVRKHLPAALDEANDAVHNQVRRIVDGQIAALDEHLQLANDQLAAQLTGVLASAKHRLMANPDDGDETQSSEAHQPNETQPDKPTPTIGQRRRAAQESLRHLELELVELRGQLS